MTKRSDEAVAHRRRPARMCRIDGPGITAKVLENPFNDGRRLDAGDDTQAAAAFPAGLDIDSEHPPEALWQVDRNSVLRHDRSVHATPPISLPGADTLND